MEKSKLASYFDHTVLKPAASTADVDKVCDEAIEYNFCSVCVNPCHLERVKEKLSGSSVMSCVVIGFPLGANTTEVKAFEASQAVDLGADEVDMVINVGALKDDNYDLVEDDIRAVVDAADGKTVKVIIETCLLTPEEIVKACELTESAGAHFVKTSTGFSSGGARVEDVKLMRQTVGDRLKVKASGGIRTYEDVLAMIEAGADRIGASAGATIMKDLS